MARRRLAAVVFVDLVDFTGLARRDEDAALATVDAFQAAVREAVEGREGRIVKFMGDGALAEFGSAGAAVEAALALTSGDAGGPVRAGVHAGEVASGPDGDLYGDDVNLAARIQTAAGRDEVLVSAEVARQLRRRSEYRLRAIGRRSLKGIPHPVELWAVERADAPPAGRSPRDAPAADGHGVDDPAPSIAVLPFANLSADPENEYFSDGVTEEILTALARVEGLKVISRTTVMRYKGTQRGIPEIAAELGVSTVLEGSVRKAGDRVRITAQLVDALADRHVWADRYDRDLHDIFEIQADVAGHIVDALRVRLTSIERARIAAPTTTGRDAYEETLRGRWWANRRTPGDLERALEHFERATRADPEYAPAHAGIATASVLRLHWWRPFQEARDRAVEAAERAIALDPERAEPYAARAMARIFDRDWAAAEADFDRAVEIAPGDAEARQWRAHLLACLGRFDEATAEIDRALELDPLSLAVVTEAGNVAFLARRHDDALAHYGRALELDPSFRPARFKRFEAYLALRRWEDAVDEAVRLELVPAREGAAMRGADMGRPVLEWMVDFAESSEWPLFYQAMALGALGRADEALDILERAADEGDWYLVRTAVVPQADPLRGEPRFQALLERLGLDEVRPAPEGA